MKNDIAEKNKQFEMGNLELNESDWNEWLWCTDMHEPIQPRFNLNHLYGLLLSRYKALLHKNSLNQFRVCDIIDSIVHSNKNVADLTFKEFRNMMEDIQIHWHDYFKQNQFEQIVDVLFVRFGMFNLNEQTFDDLSAIDPENPLRLNDATLRRFLSAFCVMYRHIDLEAKSNNITKKIDKDFDIQNFHVQAGLDIFYEHAMLADLPLASRIQYKQDFKEMYHSVSQVTYFHYPNYARKKQISLEDIQIGNNAIHCLSVALQLRPDIPCVYEDEMCPPSWCWMLLTGGTVYLISPDKNVYCADRIWNLFQMLD
jgi:hypothetical protein